MSPSSYRNPILPGFFPDPSCIKVGASFFLVNSSFQIFPGIPIHESTDLVNWKQIGNAICRPSQIDLNGATTRNTPTRNEIFTGGLFAPTIRHHDGVFYIFCTNLYLREEDAPHGDYFPRNFFIKSRDLRDPSSFSDPIYYDFYGIDPSIFFDDDGKAYVQGSFMYGYETAVPATVIRQLEIDLTTGATLSPARDIWKGHSDIIPEGPHIYRKDGFYYLLVAEGGTFDGHMLTMARSAGSVWGPYEACDRNPVITASNTPDAHVQRVGHGELVFDDEQNQWWAIVLACRSGGVSSFPLGRETYLTPVEWPLGEFPHFEPVSVDMQTSRPMKAQTQPYPQTHVVTLESPETIYLRTPNLQDYEEGDNHDGGTTLLLTPSSAPLTAVNGTTTFVGRRQQSLVSSATVTLQVPFQPPSQARRPLQAGIAVYKDTNRHFSLYYEAKPLEQDAHLVFRVDRFDGNSTISQVVGTRSVPSTADKIQLGMRSSLEQYSFYYVANGEEVILGSCDGKYLSGNDFTGALIGIFAVGEEDAIGFDDFMVIDDQR